MYKTNNKSCKFMRILMTSYFLRIFVVLFPYFVVFWPAPSSRWPAPRRHRKCKKQYGENMRIVRTQQLYIWGCELVKAPGIGKCSASGVSVWVSVSADVM